MFINTIMKVVSWLIQEMFSLLTIAIASLDASTLALLVVSSLVQEAMQPEKGIALLLLMFTFIFVAILAPMLLRREVSLLKLLGVFIILEAIGVSIFAVTVMIIRVISPTPANIAFLLNLLVNLAPLAVNMVPMMALVALIPFVGNLLNNDKRK